MTNPKDPSQENSGNLAPDTQSSHIGRLIRRLREEAGLTRKKLVGDIDISDSTLKNIETGRYQPTSKLLRKLLRHPALVSLYTLAKNAGLPLDRSA